MREIATFIAVIFIINVSTGQAEASGRGVSQRVEEEAARISRVQGIMA